MRWFARDHSEVPGPPVLRMVTGASSGIIDKLLLSECSQQRPPFSPKTRIFTLFSSPAAICVAINTPVAPEAVRKSTAPSSSKARPPTTVFSWAQTSTISSPLTYYARLKACVPISPMAPTLPDFVGSVRHAAWVWFSPSKKVDNQPWGYST